MSELDLVLLSELDLVRDRGLCTIRDREGFCSRFRHDDYLGRSVYSTMENGADLKGTEVF